MKYEVTGDSAAIGPGQRLKLFKQQIETRTHALTVVSEKSGEVESLTQLVFKKGEILDLAEDIDKLPSYLKRVLTKAPKEKVEAAEKVEADLVKRRKARDAARAKAKGESIDSANSKPEKTGKADAEKAAALKAAEDAVVAAKETLAAAATDDDKKAAQADLDAAEANLAELKA